jgi:hypothetical protein
MQLGVLECEFLLQQIHVHEPNRVLTNRYITGAAKLLKSILSAVKAGFQRKLLHKLWCE